MSKKLTDWFPADVKPVHIGVYETNAVTHGVYQKWDGEKWCTYCPSVRSANMPANSNESEYQNVKWRGLAVKP